MLRLFERATQFIKRHWLTAAFLLGFIVDNLTLNRVDQLFDNAILLMYIILAMASMTLLYAGVAGRLGDQWSHKVRAIAPAVIQYAFGGLLSGMLIFYGRSSSIGDSWPFLIIILLVIYWNETLHERSERLIFNLSIFFVGLFSYCILIIPVVTGKMGPVVFMGSGALALFVMYWFFVLLRRVVPNFLVLQKRKLVLTIGLIFVSMNVLYFTNVIPPIPLSLKQLGIYHSVVRHDTGEYQLKYEQPAWWEFLRDSDHIFHARTGDTIFCFARVFAPTRLESTTIYHRWEWFDDVESEWTQKTRISYPVEGGRDDGYRGYTLIGNYVEGEWRCTVETERGQVLGRETFTVKKAEPGPFVTRTE